MSSYTLKGTVLSIEKDTLSINTPHEDGTWTIAAIKLNAGAKRWLASILGELNEDDAHYYRYRV